MSFMVILVCFEVSLISGMWYIYAWFNFGLFRLKVKFFGYFECENKDHRAIFFSYSKFELLVLDILNIFYDCE